MLEYHGWITLRDSPGEGDERRTDELANEIEQSVARIRAEFRELGMRVMNGSHTIWMAGFRRRWTADMEQILGLFREVAEKAPGSYGLLYVWNGDVGDGNAFQVWRLAKGQLTEHKDTLLSPCIPTIEDPDDSEAVREGGVTPNMVYRNKLQQMTRDGALSDESCHAQTLFDRSD